jgi:hypothetical protein
VYQQPTGRRFGPAALVVVTAVLAIMAGTMGYLGAHKIMTSRGSGTPTSQGTPGRTGGAGSTSAPGRTAGPGSTTNPGGAASGSPPPINPLDPGTFCPKITEQAVVDANLAGALTLLLYVDVTAPSSSPLVSPAEAWVCQNSDGLLIYQGHVKSGPFTVASSDSSILIVEGIRGTVVAQGSGFLATNPNPGGQGATTYQVTSTSLILTKPDGSTIEYPVARSYP